MSNRHTLRTVLMQSLYETEFHPELTLADIAARHLRNERPSDEERAYVEEAVRGLTKHHEEIDGLIVKHAPEWPLEQIATIDRAVLRLGIYEVLYSDEIPPKVAINEAVEIAKAFGGENSGSFVNGVLGTVYRGSDKYDDKDDHDREKNQSEAAEPAGGQAPPTKD